MHKYFKMATLSYDEQLEETKGIYPEDNKQGSGQEDIVVLHTST